MAGIQSSVRFDMGFGVPGQIISDAPHESHAGLIESASSAYNIVGATAFTQPRAGGAVAAGGAISSGNPFFGILANPKVYASFGTSAGGPLAATMTLANEVEAEFVRRGQMVIKLAAACSIGDLLIFDNTTGVLSTVSPFFAANVTIAVTSGVATVNSITKGSIGVGTVFLDSSGNKVATVTALGSGTGGTGTYTTDNVAGVAAADYTGVTVVATGKSAVPNGTIYEFPNTGAGLAIARIG